jgi:hypothetical protein
MQLDRLAVVFLLTPTAFNLADCAALKGAPFCQVFAPPARIFNQLT